MKKPLSLSSWFVLSKRFAFLSLAFIALLASGCISLPIQAGTPNEGCKESTGRNSVSQTDEGKLDNVEPPLATFNLAEKSLPASENLSGLYLGQICIQASLTQQLDQCSAVIAENSLGEPVGRHRTQVVTANQNTPNRGILVDLFSRHSIASPACLRPPSQSIVQPNPLKL